jgi:hypothetical protein
MISRRALLVSMAAAAATPSWAKPELVIAETPFTANLVADMARELAKADYVPVLQIPQEWPDL